MGRGILGRVNVALVPSQHVRAVFMDRREIQINPRRVAQDYPVVEGEARHYRPVLAATEGRRRARAVAAVARD